MPEDYRRYADEYRDTVKKNIHGGADDGKAMQTLLAKGININMFPDPDDAKPIANKAPLTCAFGVGEGIVKVTSASGVNTSAPDSVSESDTMFIPFTKCNHPSNPDKKCKGELLVDRWINTSTKNLLNNKETATMNSVLVCVYGCLIAPKDDAQFAKTYSLTHLSPDKKAIIFEDERYDIYVPDYSGIVYISAPWENVHEQTLDKLSFDFAKAILGFEIKEMETKNINAGELNSTSYQDYTLVNGTQTGLPIIRVSSAIYNSVINNLEFTNLNFLFQKSGETKRVIIQCGTGQRRVNYNNINYDLPQSVYLTSFLAYPDDFYRRKLISDAYEEIYQDLSKKALDDAKSRFGESFDEKLFNNMVLSNLGGTFNVEVTFDELHKSTPYSSYIYFDANKRLVESPIIFPKDQAVLGKRHVLGFQPLIKLSIDSPTVANPDVEQIVIKSLADIRKEEHIYAN